MFSAYGQFLSPACEDMAFLRLEHLVQLAQMYLSRPCDALENVEKEALSRELVTARDAIVASFAPGLDVLAEAVMRVSN